MGHTIQGAGEKSLIEKNRSEHQLHEFLPFGSLLYPPHPQHSLTHRGAQSMFVGLRQERERGSIQCLRSQESRELEVGSWSKGLSAAEELESEESGITALAW